MTPRRLLLLLPLLLSSWTVTSTVVTIPAKNYSCKSLECVTLAAGIASMMNQSADPCEDFHAYACGNFPNIVSYDPKKVSAYASVGDRLYEDSAGLMTEKIEKKMFELMVLEGLASDSDADIRDLYNLTRQFFVSCTEWMREAETSSDELKQVQLSASFLKAMFDHLMQTIKPVTDKDNRKLELEEILAAMVRAGGSSLISVTLPEWRLSNPDLTNVSRVMISTGRIPNPPKGETDSWLEKLIAFVRSNQIVDRLKLDNASLAFNRILGEMHLSRLLMNERLAMEYPVKTGMKTVADLDAVTRLVYPNNTFSWTRFFEHLLQSPINPDALVDVFLTSNVISAVSYFKMHPVYADEKARQFSEHTSYLIFHWLMSFGEFLPSDLSQTCDRNLGESYGDGRTTYRPRAGRVTGCLQLTKQHMQPIVERMYKSVHHVNTFGKVKDLIHLVKRASIASVRRQSWIKNASREAIVEKIKWVKHSIGFDDLTVQQLKDFYNATLLTFRSSKFDSDSAADNFGKLAAIVLCANARKNFELMGGSSPVSVFTITSPMVVNAYNFIERNRIVFPMAILEPPVYHPSYPDYINLATLGFLIGHEIGHSFDNDGHELNRLGAIGHFWDNETESAYLDRLECVRSCYDNYTLFPNGPNVNSNGTLGNDISDIIGIQAAFNALQMLKRTHGDVMPNLPNLQVNLNQDQLFFVHAAQGWCVKAETKAIMSIFGGRYSAHSPHYLRIRGMMQNSWDFQKTFSCKLGQGMHPGENKCGFW